MISKMTCSYWQFVSIENYPFIMSFACSIRTENLILLKVVDQRSPEQQYYHNVVIFVGIHECLFAVLKKWVWVLGKSQSVYSTPRQAQPR